MSVGEVGIDTSKGFGISCSGAGVLVVLVVVPVVVAVVVVMLLLLSLLLLLMSVADMVKRFGGRTGGKLNLLVLVRSRAFRAWSAEKESTGEDEEGNAHLYVSLFSAVTRMG